MTNNLPEQFVEALGGAALESAVVSTSALVFSESLRKACEDNVCGNYNKCWTCPPAVGSFNETMERVKAYQRAFVFTTRFELEDSFDYEGMTRAKELHDRLTRGMHEKFGGKYPVYGAGGCSVCEACAYPGPCRFKDRAITSIEAAGIHVTELSRAAGVKYNNGPNTVTYFSMILFNDCP